MSTILITGANGSLGLPVTGHMLSEGHRVIAVTGRSGPGRFPKDPKLETYGVNLMNDEETGKFIGSVKKKHHDLQAAVLLAGGFAMGKLSDTPAEELDKMIRLNFHTAYHIVHHLLPYFLERKEGGQFILVGSKPGLNASEGKNMIAYTLGKSLVFRLAELINAEGKDKNVSATVLVPSTIDTEANRKAMPDADFSGWVPPDKIADTISFVLSDTGKMLRKTIIKIYNRS